MIDKKRFSQLIIKAKGDRNLSEFAEKADISKFTLSRFQAGSINNVPNESTLSKIADASEGRVTLYEFLVSVGKYERAEELKRNDIKEAPSVYDGELFKRMKRIIDDLVNDLSKVHKVKSVEDWIDTFDMLSGGNGFSYKIQDEIELDARLLLLDKHNGSTHCTPVTFMLKDESTGITGYLVFALFYCKTQGTGYCPEGIVILDKVFDLAGMASLDADDLFEMYRIAGETENAEMKDFKLCYYEK